MNTEFYLQSLAGVITATDKYPTKNMNIIFDLSGVLFSSHVGDNALEHPGAVLALKPINFPFIIKLLNDCIKQGHRLFVVSNWTKELYEFLQYDPQTAAMFELFDDVILADTIGIKKPDPRIFDHLIEKHRLNPERCIFIDDKQINLKAAQQVGICKGILCQNLNLEQVRQDLTVHGAL